MSLLVIKKTKNQIQNNNNYKIIMWDNHNNPSNNNLIIKVKIMKMFYHPRKH